MRWLVSVLLFHAFNVFAAASEVDRSIELADALFPDARAWKSLPDAPVLTAAKLTALKPELQRALSASPALAEVEGSGCKFFQGAIDKNANAFHSLDLNGDGKQDVIYSGSAVCAEGDVTLIWMALGAGYQVTTNAVLHGMLLRADPGSMPSVLMVARGCCADPIDVYQAGTIENPRMKGVIKVSKDTTLPAKFTAAQKPFVLKRAAALRSQAARRDAYDPDASVAMDHAVFGNILAKFMPKAKGNILASTKDQAGTEWAFVVVDAESNVFRTDSPSPASVGWMELAALQVR